MYPTTTSISGLALALTLAGYSTAQTSTVTLFVPGADPQPLVASIVGSDATATTYALQCAPGTDSSDCGFDGVVTLTEGPATAKYTFPAELDANGSLAFTAYFDCSLAGTSSAVCAESFGGSDADLPGMSTETYTGSDQPYLPVTITARAADSSAASTTTTTAQTATSSSGAATKTSPPGGSSSGAAHTTSSSTAGVPAVTGSKRWVWGGAAVALAVMA